MNLRNSFYLLAFFLFVNTSYAVNDIQIGFGGLTPHIAKSKLNYCNQWNNTGIIANKSYYLRYIGDVFGFTYLTGDDSICSPVEGFFLSYNLSRGEYIDVGILAGGYSYVPENWDDHARNTPSGISAPDPVNVKIGNNDFIPMLALDIGLYLIKGASWSLKLNNIFTPVIFNHSLAIEYRF